MEFKSITPNAELVELVLLCLRTEDGNDEGPEAPVVGDMVEGLLGKPLLPDSCAEYVCHAEKLSTPVVGSFFSVGSDCIRLWVLV